jgi:hypothetical protein
VFYQPYDLVSKRKRSKNNAQAAGKKKKLSGALPPADLLS